jgi:excinuclease ABC subunit C
LQAQSYLLPSDPGVYWYKSTRGDVLYIGKASRLKTRLLSYARVKPDQVKTYQMLSQAKSVHWRSVESEFDALLLEARLISIHQPKYNAIQKDDKSPAYIVVSSSQVPTIKLIRAKNRASLKGAVYGPFLSAYKARQLLKSIRKIFPWCETGTASRACFYYHLELCPGLCIGKVTTKDYRDTIKRIKSILSGKRSQVEKNLNREIKLLSNTNQFEQAAIKRNQLQSLQNLITKPKFEHNPIPQLAIDITHHRLAHLMDVLHTLLGLPRQYPLKRIECYDMSNLHGAYATGSLVVFIDGNPVTSKYRHFKIKSKKSLGDVQMMQEVVKRRIAHTEWDTPQLIVVDGGSQQVRAVSSLVKSVPVIGVAKRPYPRLVYLKEKRSLFYPLNPQNPSTPLLMHLISEAHRFARRYHHHLTQKITD